MYHKGNCQCIQVLSQLGAAHAMNCAVKAALVISSEHNGPLCVLKAPTKLFLSFSAIIYTKTADRNL